MTLFQSTGRGLLPLLWGLLALFDMGCAETAPALIPAVPSGEANGEEDLRSMVPAEANLVLSVEMAALRKSPWTKAAFDEAINAGEKEGAGAEQGFVKEVDRLVFAMVPALGEGTSLLVAQGRFSPASLLGMFQNQNLPETRTRYRGMEILERGTQALMIQGTSLVLAGPTVAVRAAIDCRLGQARSLDGLPWIESLRKGLRAGSDAQEGTMVASMFIQLPDEARKQLLEEIGEGETLQEVGLRLDLGGNLVLRMLGRTRTSQEAQDLAARLAQYLQDSQARPLVAAFGLGPVLSTARFSVSSETMLATLRVTSTEREFIASRMAMVSKTIAAIRAEKKSQEKQRP